MTAITDNAKLVLDAISQGSFPSTVYKFRDVGGNTDSIFTRRTLWFAKPNTFNDPFDCNLPETASYTPAEVVTYRNHLASIDPNIASISKPTGQKLRDLVMANREKVLNRRGVFCVSRSVDHILMWSHYACNHEGLALEFDMARDPDCFSVPLNVDYVTTYTPTNFLATPQHAIETVIKTKSDCWSYEAEVRFMKTFSDGAIRSVSFNPESLRRVIFGCNATSVFVDRIRQLCTTSEWAHVTFSRMQMVDGAFALNIVPLP